MFQFYVDAKPKKDFAILAKANFLKETIDSNKDFIVASSYQGEECKSL